MIGLIASLIFVGLELRQSQRIGLASQIQARAQMNVDRMIASLEGNLDALLLFTPNSFDYTELTDEEKLIADTLQRWRFAMLEKISLNIRWACFQRSTRCRRNRE